ncbi:MAG: phosphoribosylformylglycinamidine synthase subunit PurL, partial [Actinomycetota bacterium]|nr:phosphoribosylformylglycinamidine synthase subunit PurL [Actinomycetota bacterium]
RDGLLSAAHDLSDGGLAQALVESCLRFDVGASIKLPAGLDPFVQLCSESAARCLVAVPASEEAAFTQLCAAHGLPCTRLGVTGGDAVDVSGVLTASLDELRAAYEGTLPALFGPLAGATPDNPAAPAL